MDTTQHNRFLVTLVGGLAVFGAAIGFVACGGGTESQGGTVESTTTSSAKRAGMTFAECEASAEYEGGRWPVEFDNGVCKVQRPAETTTTTVAVVSFANCDEAEAAGAAPLRKGEPGYSDRLDRDHDGIACDS